jgi:hypothetical protein
MKLYFSWQITERYPNFKLHENPSSGNRVVICRQADTDRQDKAVTFWNTANVPKKECFISRPCLFSCLWPSISDKKKAVILWKNLVQGIFITSCIARMSFVNSSSVTDILHLEAQVNFHLHFSYFLTRTDEIRYMKSPLNAFTQLWVTWR